jgi:dTDP-4-amino-4,6-dideoxygalactose transaminase
MPKAEYQAKKLLTIPIHQFIKKKQLIYIVKKIEAFYLKN